MRSPLREEEREQLQRLFRKHPLYRKLKLVLAGQPQRMRTLPLSPEDAFCQLAWMLDELLDAAAESLTLGRETALTLPSDCRRKVETLPGIEATTEAVEAWTVCLMLTTTLILQAPDEPEGRTLALLLCEALQRAVPQYGEVKEGFCRAFWQLGTEDFERWAAEYWQGDDCLSEEVDEALRRVKPAAGAPQPLSPMTIYTQNLQNVYANGSIHEDNSSSIRLERPKEELVRGILSPSEIQSNIQSNIQSKFN